MYRRLIPIGDLRPNPRFRTTCSGVLNITRVGTCNICPCSGASDCPAAAPDARTCCPGSMGNICFNCDRDCRFYRGDCARDSTSCCGVFYVFCALASGYCPGGCCGCTCNYCYLSACLSFSTGYNNIYTCSGCICVV
ncbi:unnamed protein product [Rotaria sp. Silwood1]|nr:unnamed protein product [Rotaria sp. Silwood1]CAF1003426.1 unnamed protein product [Rotaria sp. Silwood1]CAF1012297.1 unnamed protein product [Rotaria sp. Silwood1]CAF3397144.1 unnamed protein product [Rotaria sp. Silwood1]CAF3412028.1 unnamed protein product [Rotaria sp. Silwood1]